ncbi:hypothetical protein Hanom_Chr01g00086121 [Helianthus anomalus]
MHVTFGDEGSSFVLLILSLRMKIGWLARESRDLVALVLLLRGNIIRGGANSSIVVVGVVLMGLDLEREELEMKKVCLRSFHAYEWCF